MRLAESMQYLWYYLILINAAAFLLMRADKQKARRRQWRIPEAALFGSAVLGGSLGATIGMIMFAHKTKKPLFSIGLPVLLLVQFGVLCFIG